jgi:cathepsin B
MGALRDPVRRAKLPVVLEESAVPATFNSTSHWPQCGGVIGHARDQSDCGCCWAFGSTESFNDRLCIKTNSTTLLSPQDTCSCCNSAHGCQSGGCDGGYTEDAFNYFMKYGLVTGGDNPSVGNGASCFPYQLKECGHHEASPLIPCPQVCSPGECATPKCPTACTEKSYTTAWTADKHKAAKGAYRLGSVAAAQADIMKNGPISAAFTVYADFLTYTSGVYKHTTGAELGGHAIKILGWGTEGGQDYWLAMNSWNQVRPPAPRCTTQHPAIDGNYPPPPPPLFSSTAVLGRLRLLQDRARHGRVRHRGRHGHGPPVNGERC